MRKSVGCLLLLLASTPAAMANPTKFACDAPQGKRVELGPSNNSGDARWIDDNLDTVRPAVLIDGQTLSVTWGTSVAQEGAGAKVTTYVFAAARRDATSILATRVDETTAEIFRFYFASKVLYKLTTRSAGPSLDGKVQPPFIATHFAVCREQ